VHCQGGQTVHVEKDGRAFVSAWIVRAGRYGEREQWALENGVAGGGFHEVPDLSPCGTKEQIRNVVERGFPGDPPGRLAIFTGQLWALRDTIQPGDLIVMPMKTTKRLAIGECRSGYRFRGDEPDPNRRHTVEVDWKTSNVSRASVKDDLLNTLNGAMTVFQASKNNADARLRELLRSGVDPGRGMATQTTPEQPEIRQVPPAVVDDVSIPRLRRHSSPSGTGSSRTWRRTSASTS
jgi:restriction system protein